MIFWDLDGVLANFNKGAKGLIFDAGLKMPAEDDWHYLSNPMYKEQVNHIASSQCFWRKLEAYPEAIEAFNSVRDISTILSCPQFFASATPKLEWCHKHLGIKTDKVVLTSAKTLLAKAGTWLIDDKSGNCDAFAMAGGMALLVRHPYSFKDGTLREGDLHPNVCVSSIPKIVEDVMAIKKGWYE